MSRNLSLIAPLNPSDVPASPLTLRLFGAFSLQIRGREVTGLSRAAQELLTLLALRPEAPASRASLAEMLWPDALHDRALFYLRRCLTELRKLLGAERLRLDSPTPTTLRFAFADAACDLLTFDRLVEQNDEAALEQAVACYGGPLLTSCESVWVLPERAARMERYCATLRTLASRREERGDLPGAARLLRRAVEADPLCEATTRRLMQMLARQGDYAGLETQFRHLRHHLHSRLNQEPSAETLALRRALLSQTQTAPVSNVVENVPPNRRMPCPLTSLIGRTRDREEISAALRSARLVTLTGSGGVGKTRLALAVGEDTAEDFPDGAVFVDLSSTQEGAHLPRAVAVALGASLSDGLSAEDAVCRFLRRKRLLLVLDNAEHLLTAGAQFAATLLRACPALHLLCTSREPLRVPGEWVWQVLPLATPPDVNDDGETTRLLAYDAAALLVERASAASATFRLSRRNTAAVARICRRLDGIPLALELAAARFRSLSAQEIAARLDDRFRLLSSGNPALPRHRTLRAALEWSDSLLSKAERRLLRQVSVFVGSWTLDAAEAVCPPEREAAEAVRPTESEPVLPLLLSLVDKSLVVYAPQFEQDRYRLLETTREYTAEQLSDAERRLLEERHAAYFLRWAQAAVAGDVQVYVQAQGVPEHLWADYENLRAARDWWHERDAEAALWLEYRLYSSGRERPRDWQTRVARLEATPLPTSPLSLLITYEVGCWALWTGHPAREALLRRAADMATELKNTLWKIHTLSVLNVLEAERGNDSQALVYAEAMLASAREYGNIYSVASCEAEVCHILLRLGAWTEARQRLQAQLKEGRRTQEWRILLPTLNGLAELAFMYEEWDEARACWEECLPLTQQFSPSDLPNQWRNLARVARQTQDYDTAWHYLEQALLASRRNRSLDREGWTRWEMSEVAFRQGNLPQAREQLSSCLRAFQDNEEPRVVAQCLRKAALYHTAEGRYEHAARLLGHVTRMVREQELALFPEEQKALDGLTIDLRVKMGEKAWQMAVADGKAMTLAQVETLAFACEPPFNERSAHDFDMTTKQAGLS